MPDYTTTSLGSLPLSASARWSITDMAVMRMTSRDAAPIWGLVSQLVLTLLPLE
jgi:hypothetical protein